MSTGHAASTAPVTAAGDRHLFGPFALIDALDLPGLQRGGLYEGHLGACYDRWTRRDRADLGTYLRAARQLGGPVLELGCGSGRVLLALLRAGLDVVGVDTSPAMLDLAREAVARELPARCHAAELVAADVRTLDLGTTFPLVLLPATTICLFPTAVDRRALFAAVARHLAPGGRFLFDVVVPSAGHLTAPGPPGWSTHVAPDGTRSLEVVAEEVSADGNVQHVNAYVEVVRPDGTTERHLGHAGKAILDLDRLADEWRAAGLELVERGSYGGGGLQLSIDVDVLSLGRIRTDAVRS